MASIIPARSDIPADDELDDILNGIVDGKDVFDTSDIQARAQPPAHQKSANDSNLGLEEIKIVKQRRPIPKLDDNRYLLPSKPPYARLLVLPGFSPMPGSPNSARYRKTDLSSRARAMRSVAHTSSTACTDTLLVWRYCANVEHVPALAGRPLP